MVFKNPIFISGSAFLLVTIYLYFDIKKKTEDKRLQKGKKEAIINWKEFPWYIPIITGVITWIFSNIYFNSKTSKIDDLDMKEIAEDLKSFQTEMSDISVNYAVPPAVSMKKIYTTGQGENVALDLW